MRKNKKNNKPSNNIAKKFVVQTGKFSAMILKILLLTGFITIDQMFSPSIYKDYGINYKKLWNEPLFNFGAKPEISPKMFKRASIYASLHRLQRQGLVSNLKGGWLLTQEGKGFAQSFLQLRSKYSKQQLPKEDGVLRVVIFDILEQEREKRDWIRGELLYHNYKPLQKSVWIGRCPLLPKFVNNINFLNLSESVHVFSVKDEGTISKPKRFRIKNNDFV